MERHAGFPGLLLRRGRLEKNWSQEGLCRGICTVSYLSKIEKGDAAPSGEILSLLFARLGLNWHDGEDARRAEALAEQLYDALTGMDDARCRRLFAELDARRESCLNGPFLLDFALLERFRLPAPAPALPPEAFAAVMTPRQRALWLLAEHRCEEALPLDPTPFAWVSAGLEDYRAGRYAQALQRLQRGFELAAAACLPYVMLRSQLFLGNCYSDLNQYGSMLEHYRRAGRLAEALGDAPALHDIRYNIAATQIQQGQYREALAYFESLEAPTVLELHKLAICRERLGRPQAALAALEKVGAAPCPFIDPALAQRACQVVRYRLTHPGYLHEEAYGALLLGCFAALREAMPQGYAAFHLPWVEEWYLANRQYKQAWALLRDFPNYSRLKPMEAIISD